MKTDRLYALLGLAQKAGKIESGEFCCENAVKSGKVKLMILSAESSDNTRKKFTDMCSWRKIPCMICGDHEHLGRSVGKEFRACVCVTDQGFADAMIKILEAQQ